MFHNFDFSKNTAVFLQSKLTQLIIMQPKTILSGVFFNKISISQIMYVKKPIKKRNNQINHFL
ncbi:hypothetical protein FGL01_19420 [Flavobacterium glycines]|uniref:Uncharacterized protein n=1 Tax=Flavobacterium glycines TaxID=551990 RepID=A0A1B9DYZ8_9FLAO|nr:hypothetical protein FBGL_00150 [Flavobacterium glycines]GEL11203.1 hypothetical protein FGL01_19420 [Flavobacterium glycines]